MQCNLSFCSVGEEIASFCGTSYAHWTIERR